MNQPCVYLDYNASAPLWPSVKEAIREAMDICGNPSATHADGRATRALMEKARRKIAEVMDINAAQVVFTSGGTEANGLAMHMFADKVSLCSQIEHPAVREWVPESHQLPVTSSGVLDLEVAAQRIESLRPDCVSLMSANNETGVIQPLEEVKEMAEKVGAWMHVDGVQSFMKKPHSFPQMGIQSFAISAHKIGGPQGVGALILQEGTILPHLIRGGAQERNRRAGTPNVLGIVGMGAAIEAIESYDWSKTERLWKDLQARLKALSPHIKIHGEESPRISNTLSFSYELMTNEEMMMALDLEGISVSAGAACSSGKVTENHVLRAMGIQAGHNLRVSLGWDTTEAEIEKVLGVFESLIHKQEKRTAL